MADNSFGQMMRYDLDEPDLALKNALRSEGYNTFSNNPFMKYYMRSAPGLALSYAGDMSAHGLRGDPVESGRAPDFGNYLRGVVRSGGQGITNKLAAYQPGGQNSGFNAMVAGARQYADADSRGGVPADVNPFTKWIADRFASGDGRGLTRSMAMLRSPLLGSSSLATSYQGALDDSFEGALMRASQDNGRNTDIWRYILGY